MAENPTKPGSDAPHPAPPEVPKPTDDGKYLKPTKEFHQKGDGFKRDEAARQDAGLAVDHSRLRTNYADTKTGGGEEQTTAEPNSDGKPMTPHQRAEATAANQYADARDHRHGIEPLERLDRRQDMDRIQKESDDRWLEQESRTLPDRYYDGSPSADDQGDEPPEPGANGDGSRSSGHKPPGSGGGGHDRLYGPDSTPYPEGEGALGHLWEPHTLTEGAHIDRYGADGRYASPEGTPLEQRALPPGTDLRSYRRYEVIEPIPADAAEQSITASYYGERDGGGLQYRFKDSLAELERKGYLRDVT
jgi:hypothetical protein